ncbi:RNA polymerase factor sigma-54 [Halobacillus sp. Marseille-Q1614]|uniref:RNA polymerase factor sigma-54 n=1 Tax=Halobacillus sp. Marseille-Q1614 TaxID=2709134 RepID=UPI00156DDEF6|nr:RNA polymerase factor sigma-54 [Halobacillus sp. Marseille-Q1614]
MKLELSHNQSTRLKMTKELRQAISLLQYSSKDMVEFIREQALENPLLEVEERQPSSYMAKAGDVEDFPDQDKDWRQKLMEQVQFLERPSEEKRVILLLIETLDEHGFLPYSLHKLAELFQLSEELVRQGVEQLKQLDPGGLGCRGFSDYLLFQIEDSHPLAPVMQKLITDHLEDVAEGKYKYLALQLEVEETVIEEAVQSIQDLQPRPLLTSSARPEYIIPDFYLIKSGGCYEVHINDGIMPRVRLNSLYSEYKDLGEDFIKEAYNQASWLLRSIDRRQTTMRTVAQSIVDKQTGFFDRAEEPFKPLTLRLIAEELGIHESTVSRTIASKYIETDTGPIPLTMFFTSSLSNSQGEDVSSSHVKDLILQYIKEEDKRRPLSDQKIKERLQQEHHIQVSRRTIAKYREGLHILSSVKRKHQA